MNSFRIKLSKGTILPFSFLLQLPLGNWKLSFLILSLHKKFYFLTLFTTPNSSIYPEWFHSGSEWIHSVLEWIHTVPEYIHSGLTFLIVTLPRSHQSRHPAPDSHKTQNMLPVQYFNLHSRPIFIKYLNILNIFQVRMENCDVGMNLKKNYNRIRIELNIQTPTDNSSYLNIFIKHLPFIYIKYLSHHNTSTRRTTVYYL